jgi:hypothetical protein
MMELVELLKAGLPVIVAGVGVYAAIKADLAATHERSTIALASADKAHNRIDELLKESRK